MMMADRKGIISSIIYSPDDRTQITKDTKDVLYTVYAPLGIEGELLREHLNDINHYMQLIAPDAHLEQIWTAPQPLDTFLKK
jgi:DNA/RNA-binding domain of Phe-tRNA-synthetase-like protein